MKSLVIDTTSMIRTQIGISDGSNQIELNLEASRSQEQKLLNLIDLGLKVMDLKISDLDQMSVTLGPGSFTGLRIGISTLRALSYSLKIPIKGAESLWCIAESTRQKLSIHSQTIVPVIDAKMKRVYASIYQDRKCLAPAMDILPENLIKKLKEIPNLILSGDGIETYFPLFQRELPSALLYPTMPGGQDLLHLFASDDPNIKERIKKIFPIYLRKSQAEEMADKNKEI